ncbi:MAG: tetratricopeptide repeat protein [Acidobacteria bacterium]|nr:tetratricopeptide repeat protein [Acidobacteriota bacterium]
MAPGLDEMLSQSPAEKHRLYTEHSPQALAAIEGVLAVPGPSPVLILAGEPGCGRTGLLEAAAHGPDGPDAVSRDGREVLVLPLDLQGYEEGLDLLRFAEIQIARRWELNEAGREELGRALSPMLPGIAPSLSGAAVVALLLRVPDPRAAAREIFPDRPDPRESLTALLRLLARDGRFVLHAVASPQLTDPLRLRLLDEARANPNLLLAVSCSPREADERVAPRSERLRLDLTPLPAGDLLAPVKDLLDDLDLETADRLQRFLDLAALCGDSVPAELLFHHLELDEEQQEEILDTIDEELVENEEQRLFVDHQYGHPSFPGLLTYSFLSPLLNQALLEPLTADKRRRLALELLEFVDQSMPLHTRGMALLRLALAEHLEDAGRRTSNVRDLRVWIGEEEVDEMAADLARALDPDEGGLLTPENLLGTAQETEGRWPPHVRLAFVEAVRRRPDALTPAGRVGYHLLRASLLRETGRRPEALEEARTGLEAAREVHGPEGPTTIDAMSLLGVLLREARQPEEARLHLERALELRGREAGTPEPGDAAAPADDPQRIAPLATLLASLGLTLYDLSQREAAREHLLQALELHRQAFGDVHPAVANDLRNLAVIARDLGDPQQALQFARPIVDILRQMYGDVHPSTAEALTDVASLLRALGESEGARLHLEAALQIDQQAYGEAHPQVVADLNNLALVERDLGDLDAARDHLEQALAMAETSLGEDHALTVQLRRAMAEE